jgi:predicted acyltransferase
MLILLSIIVVTPLAQAFFGYSGLPLQVPLIPVLTGSALPAAFVILRQWLVEGWFPILPWLAVALLGAHAGTFRWRENSIRSFADRELAILGFGALAIGALLWYILPGPALTPYGYVELFYPPTMEFLLFITGLIFCLFSAADWLVTTRRLFEPLLVLGQCSLAIYVIHTLIIELLIRPLQLQVALPLYLAGSLLFIAAMIVLACMIRSLRLRLDHPPFIVRVLIGG